MVGNSDQVSVTFELFRPEAHSVHVVGEFNNWDMAAHPMKRRKDGAWSTTLRLPRAGKYQYRFVIDDRDWQVDEDADVKVPNPFGGENALIET